MLLLSLLYSLPSFARAGDLDDEVRLIDLELRMLSLERAAIDARSREADRERAQQNADLERDISSYREHQRVSSSLLELDHITVLDPSHSSPPCASPGCSRRTGWPPCRRKAGAHVVCGS
jgi:hypothetical protein